MKKIIIIIIVVAIVICLISMIFTGIIPLSLLDHGTTTKVYDIGGGIIGNRGGKELLGPLDKKGFICSWRNNGHSETITVQGTIEPDGGTWWWLDPEHYRYKIFLKRNSWSEYELHSGPAKTTKYITNPNPGNLPYTNTLLESYSFTILGNEYSGGSIKAELWVRVDLYWGDDRGTEWYRLVSDEAYLYSGYGELRLPSGITEEGVETPFSTFEIGETVKIGVGTGKGGYTEDNLNWRVTLNAPYTGLDSIEDLEMIEDTPDRYGAVIHEEYFPDDTDAGNTFFEFTVTEDMASRSMNSPYPFTVRIWNTLMPKGTINIDFVDFIYNSPGNAIIEGLPKQAKINQLVTAKLSANINPNTQADIDYFRVAIVYGTGDTLVPGDQSSDRWVLHTSFIGVADQKRCNLPQTVTFTGKKEHYVTIFVHAIDVQGRASPSTRYDTVWFGKSTVPDEVIEDETTGGDYGGGHTTPWLDWDPGGGNWEKIVDTLIDHIVGFIVCIIIIGLCSLLAIKLKLPYGFYGKALLILIGVCIGVLAFIFI